MKITDTSDLWWKTAVVYCLDVETFLDWDGDGIGDFAGLAQRIDYLADLGVTCLWLMPFYPTPERDDGYDITDFYGVDPRLGNHGDLVEVVRTARDRGMRVIVDLVVNHTSDKHPWFRAARASRTRRYRDWYVWRDEPPKTKKSDVVFPDQETSIWELRRAGRRVLPAPLLQAPARPQRRPTRRCATRSPRSWGSGCSSACPASASTPCRSSSRPLHRRRRSTLPDPHDYLRELRAFLGRRSGDAILLGEVNLPHASSARSSAARTATS